MELVHLNLDLGRSKAGATMAILRSISGNTMEESTLDLSSHQSAEWRMAGEHIALLPLLRLEDVLKSNKKAPAMDELLLGSSGRWYAVAISKRG